MANKFVTLLLASYITIVMIEAFQNNNDLQVQMLRKKISFLQQQVRKEHDLRLQLARSERSYRREAARNERKLRFQQSQYQYNQRREAARNKLDFFAHAARSVVRKFR